MKTKGVSIVSASLGLFIATSLSLDGQYLPSASPNQPGEQRAETAGKERVSLSGGLIAPEVKLEVPEGRRGMTPVLSLVYAPGIANGELGAGWMLAAGSKIERLSATRGIDDVTATSSSRFFADGTELVAVADGSYRRLQNDFAVFRKVTSIAGQHVGWTAKKAGVTTRYGGPVISFPLEEPRNAVLYADETVTLESGGVEGVAEGDHPQGWLLSSMEDEFGNRVDYYYTIPARYTPPGGGPSLWSNRHLIERIDYGNENRDHQFSVRFSYVDRADTRVHYEGGVARWHVKLLDRIEVVAVDGGVETAVARYGFEYVSATHDSQSLLARVTRIGVDPLTGADGEFVTLRTFAYADEASDWAEISDVDLGGTALSPVEDGGLVDEVRTTILVQDVNSDGRADIVSLNDKISKPSLLIIGGTIGEPSADVIELGIESYPDHRVFLNSGSYDPLTSSIQFTYDPTLSDLLTEVIGPTVQGSGAGLHYLLTDLNRDGFPDIIKGERTADPYNSLPTGVDEVEGYSVCLGSASGWVELYRYLPSWLSTLGESFFKDYDLADINGDLLPDLVGLEAAYLHTGNLASPALYYDFESSPGESPFVIEIADPIIADSMADDVFNFGDWSSGLTELILRQDVAEQLTGGLVDGTYYPKSSSPAYDDLKITPKQFLQRNMTHVDVNSDGFPDRVYTVRLPEENADGFWDYSGEDEGMLPGWDFEPSGTIYRIFFGNGRGEFDDAYYSAGPMSNGRSVLYTAKDVDDDGVNDFRFKNYLNRMAVVDLSGSGRAQLVQLVRISGYYTGMATVSNPSDPVTAGLSGGFGVDESNIATASSLLNEAIGGFLMAIGTDPVHRGAALETFGDFDGDGIADIFRSFVDNSACAQVQGCTSVPDTSTTGTDGPTLQIYRSTRSAPQHRLTGMYGPFGGGTTYEWGMSSAATGGSRIPVPVMTALTDKRGRHAFDYAEAVVSEGRFIGFKQVIRQNPTGFSERLHYHQMEQFSGVLEAVEQVDADGSIEMATFYQYAGVTYSSGTGAYSYGSSSDTYFYPLIGESVFDFDPVKIAGEGIPYFDFVYRDQCHSFAGEPLGAAVPDADPAYRHNRTEWEWNTAIGKPTEIKAMRDVSTPDDTLTTQLSYHPYDNGLEEALLSASETWESGNTLTLRFARRVGKETIAAADYSGTEWTRTVRIPNPGSTLSNIVVSRSIDSTTGDELASTDARGFVTQFTYDDAGRIVFKEQPENNTVNYFHDAASRVIRELRSSGLDRTTEYDDLGRVVHILEKDPSPAPDMEQRFAYDWGRVGTAASALILDEPDGTQTVDLEYFDSHGQLIKRIRGRRQSGLPDTWTSSLEQAYGLAATGWIAREWTYDVHGRPLRSYLPYFGVRSLYIESQYDEWDRVVGVTFEDGTTESRSYSLDSATVVDAEGIQRVSTATTLLQESFIDGHPRVTTQFNALGNATSRTEGGIRTFTYTYDGFNRLLKETAPAVSVLNSDDAALAMAAAEATYEYLPTGEVAAAVEPDGQRFEYDYDGLGRLVEKRGPVAAWEDPGPAPVPLPDMLPDLSIAPETDDLLRLEWLAGGGERYDLEWSETLAGSDWRSFGVCPLALGDTHRVLFAKDELAGSGALKGFFRLRWWWSPPTSPPPASRVLEQIIHDDRSFPWRSVKTINEHGASRISYTDAWDRTYQYVDYDGSVTNSEYDARGRNSSTELPYGEIVEFTHDRHGRKTAETSIRGPLSSTTTFTYDPRGNLLSRTDGDGVLTAYQYDARSRLTDTGLGTPAREAAKLTYDSIGRTTRSIEAGSISELSHDSRGRVILRRDGYDPVSFTSLIRSQTTYDDLDQPTQIITGSGDAALGGGKTLNTYDTLGRLRGQSILSHDGIPHRETSYDYDISGRLTRVIDGRGIATRTDYDGRGRPVRNTSPGSGTTRSTYSDQPLDPLTGLRFPGVAVETMDAAGVKSCTFVDSLGRTRYVIAADGTVHENVYDNGLLSEERRYYLDRSLRSLRRYFYETDSARLAMVTDWMAPDAAATCSDPTFCPGVGKVTYTYTSAGRLASVTDPSGNVSTRTYLADGSGLAGRTVIGGITTVESEYLSGLPRIAASIVDPDGAPIRKQFTWQRNTRVREVVWTSAGKPTESIDYQFDEAGQPTLARLRQGSPLATRATIARAWTPAGQLARKAYTVDGVPFSPMNWTYELNGQVKTLQYPSGNVATYTYQTGSPLLDQIQMSAGGAIVISETLYDDAGRMTNMVLAPATALVAVNIVHDSAGRPFSREIMGLSGTDLRTETYGYDWAGRLALVNIADPAGARTSQYTYDARDMLIAENHISTVAPWPTVTIDYTLNPITGLRTQRRVSDSGGDTFTSFVYGAGNQLNAVGGQPVGHDAYGRQINDHRGNTYAWNLRGKLAAITLPAVPAPLTESMLFDPDGQRVRRQFDGSTTHFLLDDHPGRILHQQDSPLDTKDFIYAPDGTLLAQVSATGDVLPILGSVTGSPATAGSSGSALFERGFDAFGNVLASLGTESTEADFHGMWRTAADSGLKAAGHRFYDPDTGRFLSTDPLLFAGSANPNSALDLYRYAGQSPTLAKDPEGLQEQPLVRSTSLATPRFGPRPAPSYVQGMTGGYATPGISKIQSEKKSEGKWVTHNGKAYWAVDGHLLFAPGLYDYAAAMEAIDRIFESDLPDDGSQGSDLPDEGVENVPNLRESLAEVRAKLDTWIQQRIEMAGAQAVEQAKASDQQGGSSQNLNPIPPVNSSPNQASSSEFIFEIDAVSLNLDAGADDSITSSFTEFIDASLPAVDTVSAIIDYASRFDPEMLPDQLTEPVGVLANASTLYQSLQKDSLTVGELAETGLATWGLTFNGLQVAGKIAGAAEAEITLLGEIGSLGPVGKVIAAGVVGYQVGSAIESFGRRDGYQIIDAFVDQNGNWSPIWEGGLW